MVKVGKSPLVHFGSMKNEGSETFWVQKIVLKSMKLTGFTVYLLFKVIK